MELYLIRHGETKSNLEKRYLGWSESPLSARGRRQAEKAASFFAGSGLEAIYCSDLGRARATANVIGAGCGLTPAASPLLREIHFGEWEGLNYDEIEAKWGDAISSWLDDPYSRATPGGESLAEVSRRMTTFLDHLAAEAGALQKVAVVSHGGSIRALLHDILGYAEQNFWDLKIDNASISLLRQEEERYRVIYYNRVHHLLAGSAGGTPD